MKSLQDAIIVAIFSLAFSLVFIGDLIQSEEISMTPAPGRFGHGWITPIPLLVVALVTFVFSVRSIFKHLGHRRRARKSRKVVEDES